MGIAREGQRSKATTGYRCLSLEESTQEFWKVSQAYNNPKSPIKLTVEQGLKILNTASWNVGPQRKLSGRVQELLGNIINGADNGKVSA
jgi:hypothetical protein